MLLPFARDGMVVKYAPAPGSWARNHGFRYLASIRNEALLLAGDENTHKHVLCCPIDDDCIPEGTDYLERLLDGARTKTFYVPEIFYPQTGQLRTFVSGNAATPFWLHDALDLNGYDEILDANWPGTSTYEDIDLCFRVKGLGYTIATTDGLRLVHAPVETDDEVLQLAGLKCNHTLRVAGSFINWDTNAGRPPTQVHRVLKACPYLERERCVYLGRACEIPLQFARFGHPKLRDFINTRPKRDMLQEWADAAARRVAAVLHVNGEVLAAASTSE